MKKDIESTKDDYRVWAEKQRYWLNSNIFNESGDRATKYLCRNNKDGVAVATAN